MKVQISVDLDQVTRTLQALPLGLRLYASEDGLFAASKVGYSAARRTTLFRDHTGNLRKGLRARRGLKRYSPSALITSKAPHTHLIELGTKRMAARPFLMRAVEETKVESLNAFAVGVRRNFKRVERQLTGRKKLTQTTLRALLR